jgi:hypothetical protein
LVSEKANSQTLWFLFFNQSSLLSAPKTQFHSNLLVFTLSWEICYFWLFARLQASRTPKESVLVPVFDWIWPWCKNISRGKKQVQGQGKLLLLVYSPKKSQSSWLCKGTWLLNASHSQPSSSWSQRSRMPVWKVAVHHIGIGLSLWFFKFWNNYRVTRSCKNVHGDIIHCSSSLPQCYHLLA